MTAYWKDYPYRIHWREGDAQCNAPVKQGTIGQYIGIEDRNKVKIHEGDIVEDENDVISEIVFEREMFKGKTLDGLNAYKWRNCKVIGNIYETPELIK